VPSVTFVHGGNSLSNAGRGASVMSAIDEYDIRDTFQALDNDDDGYLTARQFHVLWQGLGFRPERMHQQDLQQIAGMTNDDSLISAETALKVLKKVSGYQLYD
jgi:Ca2+-binding EF-hand superfamily protein